MSLFLLISAGYPSGCLAFFNGYGSQARVRNHLAERFASEWSLMTKSRKYGLYKWSKMTNKTGVKTAVSLENTINSLKNPTFSTPVYSIPRMRQPCAF